MYLRRSLTLFAVALLATACTDQTPLAVEDQTLTEQYSSTNGEVSAVMHDGLLSGIPIVGTLPGGGTFDGLLSITELSFVDGELLATGTLTGTATQGGVVTAITQTFEDLVVGLTGTQGRCTILFLEIPGGLELDLLGLVVDLAPVELEVRGERGPGNLLGNLLCAVTGLLDRGGPLAGITNLLDRINGLL